MCLKQGAETGSKNLRQTFFFATNLISATLILFNSKNVRRGYEFFEQIFKLCFDVIFAMRKRNRDLEPGSRHVECFYYPPGSQKLAFDLL